MEKEIFNIVLFVRLGVYNVPEATNKILSLMGENEIGVSDATERKHGGLHDVRESHASDLSDTDGEHTNGASLEKITEDGKSPCGCCGKPTDNEFCDQCLSDSTYHPAW